MVTVAFVTGTRKYWGGLCRCWSSINRRSYRNSQFLTRDYRRALRGLTRQRGVYWASDARGPLLLGRASAISRFIFGNRTFGRETFNARLLRNF